MIYTRPENPRLIRTHPLARNISGAYLFGAEGRYVVDHVYGQNITNINTAVNGPRTRVTGRTTLVEGPDVFTTTDATLTDGAGAFTFFYRGHPNQGSTGAIFNYGTAGIFHGYRSMRFSGGNVDFLSWGSDLSGAYGLGGTAYRRACYAGTYDGTTAKLYEKVESNPVTEIASAARSWSIVKTGTLQFNKSTFSSEYHLGYNEIIYFYTRALSAAEIHLLASDPYQIFADTPRARGKFFSASAGLTVTKSDDLNNWLDESSAVASQPASLLKEAYDSMFYNIFDEFVYALAVPNRLFTDALALSDSIAYTFSGAIGFGDLMVMLDAATFKVSSTSNFSDSMNLSDAVTLNMHLLRPISDDLNNWVDLTEDNGLATQQSRSANDSLNSWDDAFTYLSSTSETAYLRQFLNDVVN